MSVIIPCFNHADFLAYAIQSVIGQDYSPVEIIVVDDGSTDSTKEVAGRFPEVTYLYQSNQGLAAARNAGIKNSRGQLLTFLDADDWLLPNALRNNVQSIELHPQAAFVSGAFQLYLEQEQTYSIFHMNIYLNPYHHLLTGNYIGMHAVVMYQRWIFDHFLFDTTLAYCEDYDLYLRITRRFHVVHHAKVIAVYRTHGNNMSLNQGKMLLHALMVLKRQEQYITNNTELHYYRSGQHNWTKLYTEKIYNKLSAIAMKNKLSENDSDLVLLRELNPALYHDLRSKSGMSKIKAIVPSFVKRWYKKWIKRTSNTDPGNLNFGNFYRTTPFSTEFGYDRGGPVDRYYIENFLQNNHLSIQGRVLEIGDNEYTMNFGGKRVLQSDILHIDAHNPKATFIGDLSNAPGLPSDTFDCIVLTQTLHLIYDCKAALETCYRILKPGGTLLLTVPGISQIAQDEWGKFWYWSFTALSLEKMLGEHFSAGDVEIETFGNTLVASAFLYGLGLPEIKKQELDYRDPHYQVIITAKAIKV